MGREGRPACNISTRAFDPFDAHVIRCSWARKREITKVSRKDAKAPRLRGWAEGDVTRSGDGRRGREGEEFSPRRLEGHEGGGSKKCEKFERCERCEKGVFAAIYPAKRQRRQGMRTRGIAPTDVG